MLLNMNIYIYYYYSKHNRATSQWFADVEAFKKRALESLADVIMLPDNGN